MVEGTLQSVCSEFSRLHRVQFSTSSNTLCERQDERKYASLSAKAKQTMVWNVLMLLCFLPWRSGQVFCAGCWYTFLPIK